jgi:hypothetical protein
MKSRREERNKNKKAEDELKTYVSVNIPGAFALLLVLNFRFVNSNFGQFKTKQ